MNEPTTHTIKTAISAHKGDNFQRLLEVYVWLILSVLVSIRPFFDVALKQASPEDVIQYYVRSPLLFTSLLICLFPFIYRLIFGRYPLESIRHSRLKGPQSTKIGSQSSVNLEQSARPGSASPNIAADEAASLLWHLAEKSAVTAKGIYSRSGVYLLIGVLVAFSGLAFFYVQSSPSLESLSLSDKALQLAPQFGILFFIEFIAFFFLRQYRSAMDEFRYYEAVQRRREELAIMVKINCESDTPISLETILKDGMFYSSVGVLASGQSTEILEGRKLEKHDMELFGKLLQVVSAKSK